MTLHYNNDNNNQSIVSKCWGRPWIFNRLLRVGHMYFFFSTILFYLKSYYQVTPLINMSLFIASVNVIFNLPLPNELQLKDDFTRD